MPTAPFVPAAVPASASPEWCPQPFPPAVVFTRAGTATSPLSLNTGAAAPASTPEATALFEFTGSDTSGVNFTCTVSAK